MTMYVVRVKDRGRDLAVHQVDDADAAQEIERVYLALGYGAEKILIELSEDQAARAA